MQVIQHLEATRDQTLEFFALGANDLARTYAPGKWSVKFILHHIADSETVQFERVRRALCEPRPVLWFYDQDAWAKGLDYARLPLDMSRQTFEPVRNAIIHLANLYYEPMGHLEYVHSVSGVHTLKELFEDVADHNEHHLSQIQAALSTSHRR